MAPSTAGTSWLSSAATFWATRHIRGFYFYCLHVVHFGCISSPQAHALANALVEWTKDDDGLMCCRTRGDTQGLPCAEHNDANHRCSSDAAESNRIDT